MRPDLTPADIVRFWSKVDRSGGPNACWPWLGARNSEGYGYFSYGGRDGSEARANRLVLVLSGVPLGRRQLACHRCDNPPCCNPTHLYAGTARQNSADRSRAGHVPRGSGHRMARLTEDQVRTIRTAWAAGAEINEMARHYGVTPTAIWLIVHRKNWTHVP